MVSPDSLSSLSLVAKCAVSSVGLTHGLRDNACRGEAYAVCCEDGWRAVFAARDPWKGFVIEAHIGGGRNSALCRDPDEVAAHDPGLTRTTTLRFRGLTLCRL